MTGNRPNQTKKACNLRSQQASCKQPQHQILSTAEVTTFVSNVLDCKEYPSKASQHDFVASCMDVNLGKL